MLVVCVCVHNKSALLYQFNERRGTSIDSPDRAPTRQAPSTCNAAEEPVHSQVMKRNLITENSSSDVVFDRVLCNAACMFACRNMP